MHGDVPRLILRQRHAAAVLNHRKGPAAQLILLAVQQLRLMEQQVGEGEAVVLPLNGKADVVDEGDGRLTAHGTAVFLRHGDNPLHRVHDAGLDVLEHLQKFPLHHVLHIVDLLNFAVVNFISGTLAEADAIPQHNSFLAAGSDHSDCAVVEDFSGTQI